MGHCKLCGYERKLIKAHIVPEPFWPSNDEGTPKILSNTEGVHPRRSPIGVYDETILCDTCDNKLGVLDQHAVEHVLNSKTRSPIEHEGKVIGYKYESACPVIMRTFIASVAWRAAMSVHLFYERVKLGPYDEAIKSALCGEGELAPSIQAFLGEFGADSGFLNPHWTRIDGLRVWVIYAGRFILYLKLDKRKLSDPFDQFDFRSGRHVLSIERGWQQSKEFRVMQKIVRANPHAFTRRA